MTTIQSASRISAAFERARRENRLALVPYVTAGYPDAATSEALAVALAEAGADVLEFGVPFSDPVGDGPTVQAASQAALERGMTPSGALELAGRITARVRTPLVLMTYYNLIFSYGVEHFCEAASAAGVAGMIVVDLPPEEAEPLLTAAGGCGLALIFLITPTSPDARIEQVARAAERTGGFIYCVSLSGVTGARDQLSEHLAAYLGRVRAHTTLPLVVGFGVSRPEHVADLAHIADGAAIGSALLNVVTAAPQAERVPAAVAYFQTLRAASQLPAAK